MTECELSWVAGLLEGEGCFRLHRDNQTFRGHRYLYFRPRVICAMTDRDVIERLQQVTGMGRITLGRKTKPGYKDYWQWTVSRDGDAIRLMKAIYPLMGERRRAKIDEILREWPIRKAGSRGRRPTGQVSAHRVPGPGPRRPSAPCE